MVLHRLVAITGPLFFTAEHTGGEEAQAMARELPCSCFADHSFVLAVRDRRQPSAGFIISATYPKTESGDNL
jgi:hypothetical protein